MQNNKKWIGQGRFDSSNSQFMHRIYLDNGKPFLQGYSKGLFTSECVDKIILIERMIKRFIINNGYVFGLTKNYGHKTLKFELYIRGSHEGIPDELILTLYPENYVFEKNIEYITDVRLNQFLQRLYEQAKSGNFDPLKLIHKKIVPNANDWERMRFKTEPDLYKWMQLKIKEGNPVGLVTNFYLKYREKHLVNA